MIAEEDWKSGVRVAVDNGWTFAWQFLSRIA
jgi:hypothetical protein